MDHGPWQAAWVSTRRRLPRSRITDPGGVVISILTTDAEESLSCHSALMECVGIMDGSGTLLIDGRVELKRGLQRQERHLFLFNDLFVVAKSKYNNNFKIKNKIKLSDMWTANCVDEVGEGNTDAMKSFVVGWPTVNFVATFRVIGERKQFRHSEQQQSQRLDTNCWDQVDLEAPRPGPCGAHGPLAVRAQCKHLSRAFSQQLHVNAKPFMPTSTQLIPAVLQPGPASATHSWWPPTTTTEPAAEGGPSAPVEPSQEEQQLCEGSNSAVSMELLELVIENGETEMSPEESWEHKEEICEAEYITLEKEKDYPKSIPLKIFAKDIGNCAYGSDRDYQLWVNSGKEEAPYPLIGHEYPYGIKMSHLRDTALLTQEAKDSTNPSSLQEPFLMEQLPREMQCQFTLKPSRLAAAQQLSDSGQKTFKRRRSIINWAFWRGSGTHLDNSPMSPTSPMTGQLFGVSLTNICDNDNLPKPVLDMLFFLNQQGPLTKGIFRQSANVKLCKELKEKLDSGADVRLDCESIFVIASVLKDFLRHIPRSIFSTDLYDNWVCVMDQGNDEEKINTIQRLLDQLPRANIVLLRYLFGVLHNIAQQSSSNQMNAYNLALLGQRNYSETPVQLSGGRKLPDLSCLQMTDSSYDSLENELNEDADAPCSDLVTTLGQGSRSMDSVLTLSDYDPDQPELEGLLTLSDFDLDRPKHEDIQLEGPLDSKPVTVTVLYGEATLQDHAGAPSGTTTPSYLSMAAEDAPKSPRRHRRCSEPSIDYRDAKLSSFREFYQKKLRKSSCDAILSQKGEDHLKQNEPPREEGKTYFKQAVVTGTDNKKNASNKNVKKGFFTHEGSHMKLPSPSKPVAISVASCNYMCSHDCPRSQASDADAPGHAAPHTADAPKSSRRHRCCSEPSINDQHSKLSYLRGIFSRKHNKASYEVGALRGEEEYLQQHKSLQMEGQKLINQSLVMGIEVGKSGATSQSTETLLPSRLSIRPRTSCSSLSSPGTSPSGSSVSSQDSAFSQISEHSVFTPTETSSPIDCTLQAHGQQGQPSDFGSSRLTSGGSGPASGQASSLLAYTKKDTLERHSHMHSVTLHPSTWLRNGMASLKNWSLKNKARAARPEERKIASLPGPAEPRPHASGAPEANPQQETQKDMPLRAPAELPAVPTAQQHSSDPSHVSEPRDSGQKTFKRRRSIINWAFWRGSGTHLDNSPMSPTSPMTGQLFGVSLTNICDNDNLPKPVLDMLFFLNQQGPLTKGIFRQSTTVKLCKELKEKLDAGADVRLDCESIFVIASVLKDFLRHIPRSIFSTDLYDNWVCVMDQGNDEEKINTIQRLLDQLPRANIVLLRYLFGVLHNIAQQSSSNQMNAYNLALLGQGNYSETPVQLSGGRKLPDLSCLQMTDSSYDSLENELNEDADAPCSDLVTTLGQGSRSMDSVLTLSDYDPDQPELEGLLTLSDFDLDRPKHEDIQLEGPLDSKPVTVTVLYGEATLQDHAGAPSGTTTPSYLSMAAEDAPKSPRRHRRCSEPSIDYRDAKLSSFREFYQKKLRKSSCDAILSQKGEDHLKQNEPPREEGKTYFKQAVVTGTDNKKNASNKNVKKGFFTHEGSHMKLPSPSKPVAISVASCNYMCSHDCPRSQASDADAPGHAAPHTADAPKSSRRHRCCSEPSINDQHSKLSYLRGIFSRKHNKASYEVGALRGEEEYLQQHKSLQMEGQKLINQSLVMGIEVGKSGATSQSTETLLPSRLSIRPRTSCSSLSSPGTSPSGSSVSSQDSAFSQISEHSVFTPTETSSPIDCTLQAHGQQGEPSDFGSSRLTSGGSGPASGQASSLLAYTKKDTLERHSHMHSVTLHPSTWLRNGMASLKNWSLKNKARAARPEERKIASLPGPAEPRPHASGAPEANPQQETQKDMPLRAPAELPAVPTAQQHSSDPSHVSEPRDSGQKTFKRRRSIINWAFWRGSGTHLDNSPMSPTSPMTGQLFGVSLTNICDNDNLPKPVLDMLFFLNQQGPLTKGIFRQSTTVKLCKELKEKLDAGADVRLDCESIFVIASVLKDFLRHIPRSIFSTDLYDNWVCVMDQGNDERKINTIQRLLDQLPRANIVLLRYLFGVLHNIAQQSSSNQMNAYNLALLGQGNYSETPVQLSGCRKLPDLSCLQMTDSSYDSLENELNEDADAPCSDLVTTLGQGSRSMDSVLTLSDYDPDQPELEGLLTLSDFDLDRPKHEDIQLEGPLHSKPVTVTVLYGEATLQDHAGAPSGTTTPSYLSMAAEDAPKSPRRHRRCSEPSIDYRDAKLSSFREFYQKKLRKSSCDAILSQKGEDHLKQNEPPREEGKTYFKQAVVTGTDNKKNASNKNVKKGFFTHEGSHMKLPSPSKPVAISVASCNYMCSHDCPRSQASDADAPGHAAPHTADAPKSSRRHRCCSEPSINDQHSKLSYLRGIFSRKHNKASYEVGALRGEEEYLQQHKSLQMEGQKLINQSLVMGIEVGKSGATSQSTETLLPSRLSIRPRTSCSSLSSPGTSPSGSSVSSQDSAFSQISEHSVFTPTETSSPIDCTLQAHGQQGEPSDFGSSRLTSGGSGPASGQASSLLAYTKKDTLERHSHMHSVTLHPSTWLRNGMASLKNWSLKNKARAARPEERNIASLPGPAEPRPHASGAPEANPQQDTQKDMPLRAPAELPAVPTAQQHSSVPATSPSHAVSVRARSLTELLTLEPKAFTPAVCALMMRVPVLRKQDSGQKTFKRRRSIINWAFWRGSGTHLDNSPMSPTSPMTGQLFGVSLTNICDNDNLPKPVLDMLFFLNQQGPLTKGIFRQSTTVKLCKELKEKLDAGADVRLDCESIFVIASVLKDFLRHIPRSIFSTDLYDNWVCVMDQGNDEEKINTIQRYDEIPNFRNLLALVGVHLFVNGALQGMLMHIIGRELKLEQKAQRPQRQPGFSALPFLCFPGTLGMLVALKPFLSNSIQTVKSCTTNDYLENELNEDAELRAVTW
ncbi:hypothetical protein QTO34_004085 [Cnephaeus nilssonii]|uniref:Rho GTPase-activating protein 20 n=1 Tax=Cnephaeus nilssonii TaxID=3371016 RepID=A0AA40HRY8_CNENI|nr:hypothetical protein QTO34_004085 [Eptesicus nilssonii]